MCACRGRLSYRHLEGLSRLIGTNVLERRRGLAVIIRPLHPRFASSFPSPSSSALVFSASVAFLPPTPLIYRLASIVFFLSHWSLVV